MPVTIKPSGVCAEPINTRRDSVQNALALLEHACAKEYPKCSELLNTSFKDFTPAILPSPNGFVRGAVEAYNNHHNLELRPEDIWFAILSQIGLYINRHAEELRGKFVAHEEKKELIVVSDALNRQSIDFGLFATAMSNKIEENVVDPELKEWMMPAFSTTTNQDNVVASVLLMGSLQEYFQYTCYLRCGLPSVTLLGEKADWEKILGRLDKLKEFGPEPTLFYARLKPVISRFIMSFDNPDSVEVKSFWNRIANKCELGSGPVYYSGWISAFCFWNLEGRIAYNKNAGSPLSLDGVVYDAINSADFPPGYASVPFKIKQRGQKTVDAIMVAGSVGLKCSKSTDSRRGVDTISPEIGWWAFETKSQEHPSEIMTGALTARESLPGSSKN